MLYYTLMGLKLVSYIPSIVGVLLVGLIVLLSNPKNTKNKLFALVNLLTAFWLTFLLLTDISTDTIVALWLLRLALFFGTLVFLSFFLFALSFPHASRFSRNILFIFILPILATAFVSFTSTVVKSVTINDYSVQPEKTGPLFAVTDIVSFFYLLSGMALLVSKYKNSSFQEKQQIKLVLYGLTFAVVMNIFTGIVLTYLRIDSEYVSFGGLSLLIFSLAVAYSIIRNRLFDIRLVALRSLGYILAITVVGILYGFLAFNLLTELLSQDTNVSMTLRIIYTLLAVVLVFTFQPIKRFFDKLTNKLFYQDAYDSQDLIDELNKSLVSTLDMATIQRSSMAVIDHYIKPDFISFALKATAYRPQLIAGTQHKISLTESVLTDPATADSTVKVILTDLLEESDKDLRAKLRAKDIAVLVRLTGTAGSEVIGAIALGAKRSGNPYTSQDIKVLEIAANTLAIAIQNALSFEEIQQFNLTLTQRVDDATHKLKRANARLVALDQNKDDFISMVSHQLRTPLTSIKGYASMLLDGDGGMPLNKSEQRFVQQILFSSQQMVAMIGDLLNLSRLNSGHFDMQRTPTDIVALVRDQIHQLKHIADQKEITIDFDYDKGMPLVTIDKDKMQQVVMNFIDNAVHYTPPKGEVVVNLSLSKRSLDLKVSDSGIGVPKSDQSKLFSRYFRANNAKKYRPSGTGIGLYMAKKVIISHGGAVIFRANPKGGSTFGFSLPLSQVITKPNKDKIDKKSSKTKEVELATAD